MPVALVDRVGASEQDGTYYCKTFRDPPAKHFFLQFNYGSQFSLPYTAARYFLDLVGLADHTTL